MRWVMRCLAALTVLSLLSGCVTKETPKSAQFRKVDFAQIPGWAGDDVSAALPAFLRSCAKIETRQAEAPLGPYGTVRDWRAPCAAARALGDGSLSRSFFETNFTPFQVFAGREPQGLFTGYYEPELRGSRARDSHYHVPLLARPADLVQVELGEFRPALKGQRVAGRVVAEGRLVPYADRRQIEAEAGSGPSPLRQALVFVDDPVDAFFMEIQGSGRIRLQDGSSLRLTYAGQNGHPYTAIGRLLVERGFLPKEAVSMQSIKSWLAQDPDRGTALMDENASYVFFKEVPIVDPDLGPPGAQEVLLTPGRSLAVDRSIHGLGMPVFVAANSPAPGEANFSRLMIAQDTGGAIIGPVRGDVFFGFGDEAGAKAGQMSARGTMFVLVPKSVESLLMAHAQ